MGLPWLAETVAAALPYGTPRGMLLSRCAAWTVKINQFSPSSNVINERLLGQQKPGSWTVLGTDAASRVLQLGPMHGTIQNIRTANGSD